MKEASRRQDIQPILHIPKDHQRFYHIHQGHSVDWRKHLLKPQLKHVPYIKRKLPISGQPVQKLKDACKDLKRERKELLKGEVLNQNNNKKQMNSKIYLKQLPPFLKKNHKSISPLYSGRSQIIKSVHYDQRLREFQNILGGNYFLKKERNSTESPLFGKSQSSQHTQHFSSVRFKTKSPQKRFKESILMKKLDPVKQRLSVVASNQRDRKSHSRKAQSSLLLSLQRRRKIKNPVGLIHVPTVIDTTSPYLILSQRENNKRKVVTEFQALDISTEKEGYQRFKQENKEILNRLSSMLLKKQRISFLQKLSKCQGQMID